MEAEGVGTTRTAILSATDLTRSDLLCLKRAECQAKEFRSLFWLRRTVMEENS